jgi:hypothetical protein
MVKSKFNFGVGFVIYRFFLVSINVACGWCHHFCFLLLACTPTSQCRDVIRRFSDRLAACRWSGVGARVGAFFFLFFLFSIFLVSSLFLVSFSLFISLCLFYFFFVYLFLFLFFFYFIFFFFSSCFLFIFSYFFCFVFFFLSFYSCLFLFYFFYFSNFTFISLYFLSGTALGVPLNNGEPSLKSPHRNELSLTMQEN